ncbi:hypothetical protein DMC30DRAFT_278875 [Rhodotorula diobovata]|uniref:TFIIS N-terminal domain-containing protein n=1 Tax=Rhodotorula diobovata TaxID=5288 RepID=A0A5C5G3N7_9BASI|nr:hypothetical protein DMC30DRAFT_278875 [Rhodotorula diobovata]
MVTSGTVLALKKQLSKANMAGDAQTCIDVLMRLESEVEPTAELLKETLIGASVNKISREACSTDVAALARGLVARWKQAVGLDNSQSLRRPSVSDTPLPPSPVSPSSSREESLASTYRSASGSMSPHLASSLPSRALPTDGSSHLVTRSSQKRPLAASPGSSEPPKKVKKVVAGTRRDSSVSTSDEEHTVVAPPPPRRESSRNCTNDHVDFSAAFRHERNASAKAFTARTASLKALYDALACDSMASKDTIADKVVSIEWAVWNAFPPGQHDDGLPTAAYKNKLRVLLTVKNARYRNYRERIISGQLDAATLVSMKPSDFITDEQRVLDEQARLASLHSAQLSASDVAEDLREKARWRPGGGR